MENGRFSRFWDYLLFLNIYPVSSWLNIIEHLLCEFVYIFPVPQTRTCFSRIISSVWASEITFLNVKERVVYVFSLWSITEWLNAMYIHGVKCYKARNHQPTGIIILVWNINKVITIFA